MSVEKRKCVEEREKRKEVMWINEQLQKRKKKKKKKKRRRKKKKKRKILKSLKERKRKRRDREMIDQVTQMYWKLIPLIDWNCCDSM